MNLADELRDKYCFQMNERNFEIVYETYEPDFLGNSHVVLRNDDLVLHLNCDRQLVSLDIASRLNPIEQVEAVWLQKLFISSAEPVESTLASCMSFVLKNYDEILTTLNRENIHQTRKRIKEAARQHRQNVVPIGAPKKAD